MQTWQALVSIVKGPRLLLVPGTLLEVTGLWGLLGKWCTRTYDIGGRYIDSHSLVTVLDRSLMISLADISSAVHIAQSANIWQTFVSIADGLGRRSPYLASDGRRTRSRGGTLQFHGCGGVLAVAEVC